MKFVKNYYSLGTVLAGYFLTRLINITSLPLFTDEAIYTRWAQIARFDASWRFISLTDGKQPLFIWFDMIFMRFVNDPLLAGRLVSVAAGALSIIGIYFLASEIFKKKSIGLLAAVLYLFYPFALVYDRMALYESLITAITIWALYLEVLLIRLKRLDVALILGMVIGAGLLTKTSAFFTIYLLPFSLILVNFKKINIKKLVSLKPLLKWAALAILSAVMGFIMYSSLRLSPFFHIIEEKNSIFVYPFYEWIKHPFEFFQGNLLGMANWVWIYITFPILVLILAAFVIEKKKFLQEKIFLIIWFLAPFVALALFGRILYPRFVLFMTVPLLVLAAFSLNYVILKFKSVFAKFIIFTLFLIFMIRADFYIIFDIARAPIPYSDLEQYINGWPAGGGIKETVSYLEEKAKDKKIFVASTGTFGSLPTYAMEIYLGDNKNIEKEGVYPVPEEIPDSLIQKSKTMPVFLFFSNQNEFMENLKNWPLELIFEHKKGIGDSYTRLYEIRP